VLTAGDKLRLDRTASCSVW